MVLIDSVIPNSLAYQAGLRKDDQILKIQDQIINDYLDYLYLSCDEIVKLTYKCAKTNTIKTVKIKSNYENLGLSLVGIIYDRLKQCQNNCLFCFVDQGAPDKRKTLSLKDDDYRFSFLEGSFITLTNLMDKEIKRIKDMLLSPLYVSVHSTNGPLRAKLMNNSKAANIMEELKELVEADIALHTQLVLCPGYNDGLELERSLEDLASLGDNILSIGLVPVGLTKFRTNLCQLDSFTAVKAQKVLETANVWQNKFLKYRAKRVVFAADEFYWLTGQEVPANDYYEDFPQLENGIGLARQLLNDLESKEFIQTLIDNNEKELGLVTGVMGEWVWRQGISEQYFKNLKILTIVNNFYGSKVTVTGLLTARDILNYLKDNPSPKTIVLPALIFNDDGKTLDDFTLENFQKTFPEKQFFVASNIKDIIDYFSKEGGS